MAHPPPPGPPPGPPPPRPPSLVRVVAGPSDGNAPPPPVTALTPPPTALDASSSSLDVPDDPAEMEKKLSRERMQFFQELEMDRVLNAFKLNPYDVLECPMEADDKLITKLYRKKSLLIHPDKVKDPRAETAFARLKQSSTHLLDEEKRKALDEIVMLARSVCLKELGLPADADMDDRRLLGLMPSFDERVRKGTREIMVDDELRRRRAVRLQHAAEGEVERKREEAMTQRKRKVEESEQWEKTRDDRISNWRTFHQKTGAKGKKKKANDGTIPTLG